MKIIYNGLTNTYDLVEYILEHKFIYRQFMTYQEAQAYMLNFNYIKNRHNINDHKETL